MNHCKEDERAIKDPSIASLEEGFVALDQELKQLSLLDSNNASRAVPTVYSEDDDDDDCSAHVDNLRNELTKVSPMMKKHVDRNNGVMDANRSPYKDVPADADAVGEILVIGDSSDSSFSSQEEEFCDEFHSPPRPDPPSWSLFKSIKMDPPTWNLRRKKSSDIVLAVNASDDGYSSELPTLEEYRHHDPLDYANDELVLESERKRPKCSKKSCLFICMLIIVPAILVPLWMFQKRMANVEQVMLFLIQHKISTATSLQSIHSPQHKAAYWIALDDEASIPPSMNNGFVDRYVLAVLYFGLGGNANLNFLAPEHVCEWKSTIDNRVYGVTECHEIDHKQVPVGLSMAFQSLQGSLPEELGLLTGLETLILQYNARLEGEFPSLIRSLRNLRTLSLEHCSLFGTLPNWLEELTELTHLGLGDNLFSGTIPQAIANMTNLKSLGLDDNELQANLGMFGSLTNLEYLYLDSNEVVGELTPSLLEKWQKLKELDLSRNQLSSTIPQTLFSHKQLRVIDLHGNRIEGGIPELEVEANGSLQYLALHDNFLTEHIPTSIGFLVALKHLDVSGNLLEGTLPNTLENIFNLEYLFVGNNNFQSEPFPTFLLEMDMLKELSLRAINMTGTLPLEIDSLSSLRYLDLSHNQMERTIPHSLGSLGDLEYLFLNDNKFSSTLPSTLSRLGNLKTVLLEQNEFVGDTDMLCEHGSTKSIETFVSDCQEPMMTCSCCTLCCLSTDKNCNSVNFGSNLDLKWEHGYKRTGEW